jgi:hypothetical protein
MVRTVYNDTLARLALTPASRTANATVNGLAIDLGLFNNDFRTAQFIIASGTVTDGSHVVTIEESADGSTGWTAVPASRIQGSLPTIVAADDDKVFQVGAIPDKQWLRVVVTTTGSTAGGILGAVAVLGAPSQLPPYRS